MGQARRGVKLSELHSIREWPIGDSTTPTWGYMTRGDLARGSFGRHTRAVRKIWTIALLLAAAPASAKPVASRAPSDDGGDFWREVLEPHGATVRAVVARAKKAIEKAGEPATSSDTAVEQRVRALGDAYGMLRYARTLSPDNVEVLGLLGTTADELGRTRQALDALEACVRLQGPEHAATEVTGRLGMIYLRLGKLDDAVRWLRVAQGPISVGGNAVPIVHLATTLAARGNMPEAIDVLTAALPAQPSYTADPVMLVSFALAVHYDRDDQPGAAFDVLDRMQATLQQELAPVAQRALAPMRFAPAEDQYYYQAMLYEALGDYIEARTEWALYASVSDAPWRRRALEHIKAIDAQRSAHPGRDPAPAARATHRRRPVP
jgi:tetratricopeptide (TPR) repeat protein